MECDKEMEAENKQILKGYYVEEGWTRPRRVMGELLERVLMFAFRAEQCAKGMWMVTAALVVAANGSKVIVWGQPVLNAAGVQRCDIGSKLEFYA
ncbi:unnamed protein product [Arctogadus glacialis]